jgi:histidinol-phosphate aminotransferase
MTKDFIALAVKGVQSLKPYQPGKSIEELEREWGIQNSLKLASNENPLGPSPKAIDSMRQQLKNVSFYPDGNGVALKTALARVHGVPQECITLGNGSNDVLELVARVFLAPGREAVFSEHAFAVYPIVTQAVGATASVAEANAPDHHSPYGHSLENMMWRVNTQTRVVFIANPNNPTGTWLDRESLASFMMAIPSDTLIIIDEAYFEYVQEPTYGSVVQWLQTYPNLVVTRTFSKIYGLAGLRIGYALSNPEVADLLNRVRQPFNVNALAQVAALAALEDTPHIRRSVQINRAGLNQLTEAFELRDLAYIPSVGNFICVDVGRPASFVYEALLTRGIIVRPVANYGFPNHLRITVGTRAHNQRVIEALDEALGL